MRDGSPSVLRKLRASASWRLQRYLLAGLFGAAPALLVSCASSGGGLIPPGNAGPLKSDFAEVEQAARSGEGNCAATEAAIAKTEEDFTALPSTVDEGLRERLDEGIAKLRADALKLCGQPLPQTTETSASQHTTTTTTTVTTPTTPTTTTETTPTTGAPPSSGAGGGTPAPPSETPSGAGTAPGGGTGPGEDKAGSEANPGSEANGAGEAK